MKDLHTCNTCKCFIDVVFEGMCGDCRGISDARVWRVKNTIDKPCQGTTIELVRRSKPTSS